MQHQSLNTWANDLRSAVGMQARQNRHGWGWITAFILHYLLY
jgi:hypothetical protein